MNSNNVFGEIIAVYTRAQAIEDGVLVDVTDMAQEAGFKLSVAITQAVWDKYVEWSDKDTSLQTFQDETGRLWDLLWMLRVASTRKKTSSIMLFDLYVIPRDGRSRSPIRVQLVALINRGDQGEPVITITLSCED